MTHPASARASDVTPPSLFWRRRELLRAAAALLLPAALPFHVAGAEVATDFDASGPWTDRVLAARYNNFAEFGQSKRVAWRTGLFDPDPWFVDVDGLVDRPQRFDLDALHAFAHEERSYRLRCVETWAMVVPWRGFPLHALLERVGPRPEARWLRFESFHRPQQAPGQLAFWLPWPYTEALSIDEAQNELTFLATGVYGDPLPKQHGAPVRLVVPWKYGFKSIKSVQRIELTAEPPSTFWNSLVPDEYDPVANVDPEVPHPRWSQATERLIGSDERLRTRPYNGYGQWVAHLYEAGSK